MSAQPSHLSIFTVTPSTDTDLFTDSQTPLSASYHYRSPAPSPAPLQIIMDALENFNLTNTITMTKNNSKITNFTNFSTKIHSISNIIDNVSNDRDKTMDSDSVINNHTKLDNIEIEDSLDTSDSDDSSSLTTSGSEKDSIKCCKNGSQMGQNYKDNGVAHLSK